MRNFTIVFLLLVTSTALTACTTHRSILDHPHQLQSVAGDAPLPWWQIVFTLETPIPGEEPKWWIGSLLAAEVLQPALTRTKGSVPFYRFHRRASMDMSGHQFSLWYAANKKDAYDVLLEILGSPVTALLKERKLITKIRRFSRSTETPHLSDTSDPN